MSDQNTLTLGERERFFRKHNDRVWRDSSGESISAIPFHIADEMLEKGSWQKHSKNLIVVLPKIK